MTSESDKISTVVFGNCTFYRHTVNIDILFYNWRNVQPTHIALGRRCWEEKSLNCFPSTAIILINVPVVRQQ